MKAVILENRAALMESRVMHDHLSPLLYHGAEDIQKTLHACSHHNLLRRTDHISVAVQIAAEFLPQFSLSLRFAVGKQPFILPEGALYIPPPHLEPETFPIDTGRREVKGKLCLSLLLSVLPLLFLGLGKFCHIVAALRP